MRTAWRRERPCSRKILFSREWSRVATGWKAAPHEFFYALMREPMTPAAYGYRHRSPLARRSAPSIATASASTRTMRGLGDCFAVDADINRASAAGAFRASRVLRISAESRLADVARTVVVSRLRISLARRSSCLRPRRGREMSSPLYRCAPGKQAYFYRAPRQYRDCCWATVVSAIIFKYFILDRAISRPRLDGRSVLPSTMPTTEWRERGKSSPMSTQA